jgi:hypothetical protein
MRFWVQRDMAIERWTEAARRGRNCRKNQNQRRDVLRPREGATVDFRSSSFWQGEHVCESGAQLGFELRAKDVSPLQLGASTHAIKRVRGSARS